MRQARALKEDERVQQYQEAQAARELRDKSARRQQQQRAEAAMKEARRASAKINNHPTAVQQVLISVNIGLLPIYTAKIGTQGGSIMLRDRGSCRGN